MFAFELGWSADIPATLNTGSPSFAASLGLPVSKTSWHCCGSQANPALWPQNKPIAARAGPSSRRTGGLQRQRGSVGEAPSAPLPLPRPVARPGGAGSPHRGLAGGSRAQEVSLSLRQPRSSAVGAAAPASPRPAAAAPWAA